MAGFESSLFPDPNPPRDIFIKKKTTKSIFVEWAPAFFMDDSDGFYYTVIIRSSSGTTDYNTKASYQNLTSLSSGTPHIICVRTTGPLGLQSESVCSGNITTSKNTETESHPTVIMVPHSSVYVVDSYNIFDTTFFVQHNK